MTADAIYISAFGEVLLYIIGAALFVLLLLLLSRLVRPNRPNPEKLSSYESGEEAAGVAVTRFNTRFYVIALVFLLFEMELVFLFPWSVVFSDRERISASGGLWGWFALFEAITFIIVLAIGLVYAWVNGHLDWVKPKPETSIVNSPVPSSMYSRVNEKYSKNRSANEKLS